MNNFNHSATVGKKKMLIYNICFICLSDMAENYSVVSKLRVFYFVFYYLKAKFRKYSSKLTLLYGYLLVLP